ncbi:MAG TPA: nuclear transport factor 2 family protein [Solirubrobacteraceae bacterium]|nr:nuclear transport factor 2 family protein [Solirubrobacteraceae bacterium]
MSEENVDVVRRAIEAFSRKDAGAFAELTAPDFEWKVGLAAVEGEVFFGREGVDTYFERLRGAWSEFLFVVEEYRDGGDTVVALGNLRGFGRGGGVPVESPVGTVFDLRGGRIWRMRSYLDHDEAIVIADLQE